MPNAITSNIIFNGDGTQTTFLNEISSAMLVAGFTEIDNHINTHEKRVWQHTDNGTNLILELEFTSASGSASSGYETYDPVSHSGTNQSANLSINYDLSGSYSLTTYNHPEFRGISILQGTTAKQFLGYLRPKLNHPANTYWDDSVNVLAFIPRTSTIDFTDPSCLQLISSNDPPLMSTSNNVTVIQSPNGNPYNLNSRIIFPATISSLSSPVLAFSSDLALIPAVGMSQGDTVNGDYYLIPTITNSECKLFVRIANSIEV